MSDLEEALLLQIRGAGLPEPEREARFCERRWRLDFYWSEYRLGAEAEGGTWVSGRHNTGKGFESDARKYNRCAELGITVVRFTSGMIQSGEALRTLEALLGSNPPTR